MGRKASPRVWREWYVTEAGGDGIHKLCLLSDGVKKAKQLLDDYLFQQRKQKEEDEKNGLVQIDGKYTVGHLAAEFLQHKEALATTDGKKRTLEFYQKNLVRFVEWYGHIEARKLQLNHYAEYVNKLRNLKLANVTVNHHLRSAKGALNHAVDASRLVKNPWGRKAALLPEKQRKRIATEEEFAKLLKACDDCIAYRGIISSEDNAQMMRDILYVLRYTAMRPGELRKLRWDYIHLDDELIIIPEHKTTNTAKNPEPRIIPILPEIKPILLDRKEKYGHRERVFPPISGEEWSDQLFSNRFKRLRERAGVDDVDRNGEKLVPYSLRHTRLTEAGVKEKWDRRTLQRFGGHVPGSAITDRYLHPEAEDIKRAALEGRERRLTLDKQAKGEEE